MGIQFRCHHCKKELKVKDFQAGRRGRCPHCRGRFRVPLANADYSLEADAPLPASSNKQANSADKAADDRAQGRVASSADGRGDRSPQASGRPRQVTDASSNSPPLPSASELADASRSEEPRHPTPSPSPPPPVASEAKRAGAPGQLELGHAVVWYVRPSAGGQYGPVDVPVFEQWLNEQRIDAEALVWRSDWSHWRVASEVFPERFSPVTPPPPPPTSPPMPPPVSAPRPLRQENAASPPPEGDPPNFSGTKSRDVRRAPAAATDELNDAASIPNLSAGNLSAGSHDALASASPTGRAELARIERRRRRRRNYWILLISLSILTIVLVVALVIVLMRPPSAAAFQDSPIDEVDGTVTATRAVC
ncbi:MAG: hypothetical protein KatS3mg111_0972 [Pirellulaceae bacterium]|nr:MAG: hypothetical protein KatS3mg111_0972 [Pirellulaceae bacterium]